MKPFNNTVNRVAPGIPTGGQFAPSEHAEGSVVLDQPDVLGFAHDDIAEVFKQFQSSARYHANRLDIRSAIEDADDATQNAVLEYLKVRSSGKEIRTRSLISRMASQAVANTFRGNLSEEDRCALKDYREQTDLLIESMGRPLTTAEEDALASEIRRTWKRPDHRPGENFHRRAAVRSKSLSELEESGRYAVAMDDTFGASSTDVENPYLEHALDVLGEHEKAEGRTQRQDRAKKNVWNAIAAGAGVPVIDGAILGVNQAGAFARSMAPEARKNGNKGAEGVDEGRVLQVVQQWENGHDNAATRALFAPFSSLGEVVLTKSGKPHPSGIRELVPPTAQDKIAIADHLHAHPKYANELWFSALSFATKHYVKKPKQQGGQNV